MASSVDQDIPINNNHAPPATKSTPARRAIWRPKEVTFSNRTSNASRRTPRTFITPPTNNSVISTQQQPTQYAPRRSPSINATRRVAAKASMADQERNRRLGLGKTDVLEPSPLIAARRDEHERSEDVACACHRGIEQSGTAQVPIAPGWRVARKRPTQGNSQH